MMTNFSIWLYYGIGVCCGCYGIVVCSYKQSCSSSSNVVSTNAARKYEQLDRESRAISEILKARGKKRDTRQFSEKENFPRVFGPSMNGGFLKNEVCYN